MAAVLQGADPWFVDKAVSPREARAALAAMAGLSATGMLPEGGVLPGQGGNALLVTATTPSPSMAVTVAVGACWMPRAGEYGYLGTLAAAGNVDIGTANATNPRIDTVVARVRDVDLGDASNGVWSKGFGIEVVPGTPSASPVAPDLSAIPSCIPLSDVRVDANVTSIASAKITDRRYWTRAAGGIRYSANGSQRPGGDVGAMPWDARVTTTGSLQLWNASTSTWVDLPGAKVAQGASVQSTLTDSGTVSSATYTDTRAGAAICGLTFVAPASGKVKIDWSAQMVTDTPASHFELCSWEMRLGSTIGSGTLVIGATDDWAFGTTATATTDNRYRGHDSYLQTGLTPGTTYNLRLMYRCRSSTTMTVSKPRLLVTPQFA